MLSRRDQKCKSDCQVAHVFYGFGLFYDLVVRALEICIGELNRYKFCIGMSQMYYINMYRRHSIGIGVTFFFGQTKALLVVHPTVERD